MLKSAFRALPLLAPAVVSAAINYFNPLDTASVPKLLSQTGVYANIGNKTLDTAVKYFEVNSALWSDGAHKDRWVIVPPGKKIGYNDTTDVFDYPDSTIFVKLFRHDTVPGDSNSRVYWETRLLVKRTTLENTLWHGFSYRWNATGTEAHLVNLESGYDTVVILGGTGPKYRKWHFPSQGDCYQCHRQSATGRGVLGFFPAQLKRPAASNPSINQVTHLFNIGVFSGTQPTATLGRRWRGMNEGVPTGLSNDERFRVIDTMARAYIAANCSGCHGTRGISEGAIGHAGDLNYDFHNFTPQIEFGTPGNTGPRALDLTDEQYYDPDVVLPTGRRRMLESLAEWGIPTSAGSGFDMKRPWYAPGTEQRLPGLISAGYPSWSTGIYRQVIRQSPKWDSLMLSKRFALEGDEWGWSAWIFKAPWGSKAWLDTLKARNVSVTTVLMAAGINGLTGFGADVEVVMPPLATYIPDTAALKILAEWALTYRTLQRIPGADSIYVTGLSRKIARNEAMPVIRNGLLIAPEGWTGKAVMVSLTGRSYALPTVGRGRYALPAGTPAGVYVFRIGDRTFRTSVLRN